MIIEYKVKTSVSKGATYKIEAVRNEMYGCLLRLIREDLRHLNLPEINLNEEVKRLYYALLNGKEVGYTYYEDTIIPGRIKYDVTISIIKEEP